MALDTRPLRRRRDTLAAFDFTPVRRGRCFGSLTPGPNLPIGSAVGQIPEGSPASTNQLGGTFSAGATFTNNGTSARAADAVNQWDANFIPGIFTSNNGAADFVSDPIAGGAISNVINTISAQISVDANLGLAAPSSSCRVAVNWTGGVAREDSLTFNPATGAILAATVGLSNVTITRFQSIANGKAIIVNQVSFTAPQVPGGTIQGTFRLYPNTNPGVGSVEGGGFQLESGSIATAFISTTPGNQASRPVGTAPRFTTDRREIVQILSANYAYVPGQDNGSTLAFNLNGLTLALGTAPLGEVVNVYNLATNTAFLTVTATVAIFIPGVDPTGGAPSIQFPFGGTFTSTIAGPFNALGARFVSLGAGSWQAVAISETHGAVRFVANGTFNAQAGITVVWFDACAGGGGGGGCAANAANGSVGGSGGSGDWAMDSTTVTVPSTAYSVTIGAAGNGGAAGANPGTAGTNTTFGALATFTGGNPGLGAATGVTGASGTPVGTNGAAGGQSILATGGVIARSGDGGMTAFSVQGFGSNAAGANNSNGVVPRGFGGGGSGGSSGVTGAASAGGAGGPGLLTVKW